MISGICSICSRPGAVYSCGLCGRQVCAEHFNSMRGICVSCKNGKLLE